MRKRHHSSVRSQVENIKKLVTDEKLHVSLMTDEKRVEIEQVSRGTVEQVYLATPYGSGRAFM